MCATVGALSGCAGPLSIVEPAGPAANTIATLWWVMLAGATAIFVLVTVLLALGFRSKEAAGDEKRQERSWIIGLGLLFPSTVLLALLGYGLWVGERLLPRDGPDLVQVQAEGR
ncbi:MAG TPA: cytochrome B, partial [Tianweitania sediminis]|nr:cytochrome B [Tianweitania sediminis]